MLLPRLRNRHRTSSIDNFEGGAWRVSNLAAATVFYRPPTLSTSTKSPGESQPVNLTLAPTPKASPASDPHRLTPDWDLGPANASTLTFAASYHPRYCRCFTKLDNAEGNLSATTLAHLHRRNPCSVPTTDHASSPPEVRSLDSAARLLTIGL